MKQSEIIKGLDYEYIERLVRTSFDVVVYIEGTHILEVHYEPEHKLAALSGQPSGLGEAYVVEIDPISRRPDEHVLCDRAVRRRRGVPALDRRRHGRLVLENIVGSAPCALERQACAVPAVVLMCDGGYHVPAGGLCANGVLLSAQAENHVARRCPFCQQQGAAPV